jgi:hypothetical protein
MSHEENARENHNVEFGVCPFKESQSSTNWEQT